MSVHTEFAWANMMKAMLVPKCSLNQGMHQVRKYSWTVLLRPKKNLGAV